jgi:small basic protein (TIGR04137 family)
MSLDRTLKVSGGLVRARSVLTRAERIAKLMDEEKFDKDKDSPFGLPKVRVHHSRAGMKAKKEKVAEGAAEAAPGAAVAAPAAGGKAGGAKAPAAGAKAPAAGAGKAPAGKAPPGKTPAAAKAPAAKAPAKK